MKKNLKTTGIILRKFNLNEADRIVTLLTKEEGKIDCIAKGARRLKSRFCGRLELFNHVQINGFRGRSLISLNEVDVIDAFSATKDIEQHKVLFYLAEITHKLIQEDQQVEGVYPLLRETLEHLRETDRHEIILHSYLTKLLTMTGFLSPWNKCATCDDSLIAEKPIWLCMTHANVVCGNCKKAGDQLLELPLIKWINFMQHYPLSEALKVKVEEKEHRAVWQWLNGVIGNILSKPLKSEAFLQEVV